MSQQRSSTSETCDLHRAVACDSLPGSVSRLESGKISCSLSSQQLFNDVAHLAVMKHFYPLINSGQGSAMWELLLRLLSDGCHMTGLFTFYIVWTQRILDRGRPSCLDGGWLTTCLFTWPGCAATISSRTHRFWPVRLSVSCRMSLYHLAIVWTYLYCICVFRDVNIDDTKCWADTILTDGLNCYEIETRPRHVLIKRREPQK